MPYSTAGSLRLRVPGRFGSGQRVARAAAFASLLVLMPGCDIISEGVVAEALFQVSAVRPMLLAPDRQPFNAREYELFQKSQIEQLKSYFVMINAVRGPSVAGLPILASHSDPVAWLQENVEVEFLQGSEILSIRLRGAKSEADDVKSLVDAVCRAYEREVVYNEKQRRLVTRDAKAKSADTLRKELTSKLEQLESLKKELGEASETSSEVQYRQIELDVLTDVYRQLLSSLELDDIESSAPPRIRMLQPAVVSPD